MPTYSFMILNKHCQLHLQFPAIASLTNYTVLSGHSFVVCLGDSIACSELCYTSFSPIHVHFIVLYY